VWLRDGTSGLRVHVTLAAAKNPAGSSRGVTCTLPLETRPLH
jgi:hypothetical protein